MVTWTGKTVEGVHKMYIPKVYGQVEKVPEEESSLPPVRLYVPRVLSPHRWQCYGRLSVRKSFVVRGRETKENKYTRNKGKTVMD